jgi:integrase
VFAFAAHEDREYITDDPAALLRVTVNRRRQKSEPDPYNAQDRDTLLAWLKVNAPQHVFTYFLLAFYTGMRTGELLALRWEDYDGAQFHVRRARVRSELTSTKTNESRHVWIPKHVCSEINRLPTRFKRDWVFLNQLGNPYLKGRHLNEHFERAHSETGLTRSTQPNYPWRHTYASLGLTAGGKPALLAKQLGHTLAVFHSTYAKWITSDKDRDAIEAAFGDEMGTNDPLMGSNPQ